MEIIKVVSNQLDSNTFVVKNNGKALIIDAGADFEEVQNELGDCQVLAIFLTHAHYDHIFNIDNFYEELNVPIYASRHAKELLYNSELNYGEGLIVKNNNIDFVYLNHNETIKIDGFEIKCFNMPGHSKCSMIYLIDGHLFTGDVLFDKGIGRTDFLTGNKNDMLDSLKKISTLDFSEVHSGHGNSSTKENQQRNLATYIKFLSR